MTRETELLERITVNPQIFAGKPIIRGRRLAVEHVLGMLAAGDMSETILERYSWLELEDIQACLVYAKNQRVPLTEIYRRLSEFSHLSQLLTTPRLSAEKWLKEQYEKTFDNWHLLVGWLSIFPQDWEFTYRRYLVDLNDAIDILKTSSTDQIDRIGQKLRADTDRANVKGTLAEISLCVFLAQNQIPYELEVSLVGKTDVDICVFPNEIDPLYLEVQYVSESDSDKRTDQISAMYGGLPFEIAFDDEKYRIKLKIFGKIKKFTKEQTTFVTLDCTEIPEHCGITVRDVCNEIFTGKDAFDQPTPYAEHHIDKAIRELVDGVLWFDWSKGDHFYPADRGLVLNPNSTFTKNKSVQRFQTMWLGSQ